MDTPASYDDANLILRLYDARRESKMREARDWFAKNFHCGTLEEFNAIAPPGSSMNAWARQVITYWEMTASMITAGVLNEHLFFQSGQELLLVYERIRDLLPEMREAYKNPALWKNLEIVALRYIEHMQKIGPEAYPAFAARVGRRK